MILNVISSLLERGRGLFMSEAERSYSDKHKALQRAIRTVKKNEYAWVADVFETTLVYEQGGRYWRCGYAMDDAGNVTLGDSTEVLPQVVYNPVTTPALAESLIEGDCVPLTETELVEATATLKLIAPGWGSSGYYSPKVLQDAAPVFKSGLKMFWDHQTAAEEAAKPEGSLDRLAAELTEDAKWMDGASGPGLYARAKVFERYKDAVKDLAPHIGVSIRASGMARTGEADGRKGPIIERITSAKSVDFVTVPGAGGQVLSLFESAGRRPAAIPTQQEQEQSMNEEQIKALVAAEVKPIRESLTAAETKVTALETENQRLRETIVLQSAAEFCRAKLATIDMPEVTRRRLAESLPARATIKDGKLDEAAFTAVIEAEAKAEVRYLQSIAGPRIVGMGATTATATTPKPEETQKRFAESLQRLGGLDEKAAERAAAGRFATQ